MGTAISTDGQMWMIVGTVVFAPVLVVVAIRWVLREPARREKRR